MEINRLWVWIVQIIKKTEIIDVQSEIANHVKTLYNHDNFPISNA